MSAFADPDRWPDSIGSCACRLLREGITAVHDGVTEDVAAALKRHPDIADAVVVSRASQQWVRRWSPSSSLAGMQDHRSSPLWRQRAQCLARYRLRKEIRFVVKVVQQPSGKTVYGWAHAQLDDGS
jgi:hypothetical protein